MEWEMGESLSSPKLMRNCHQGSSDKWKCPTVLYLKSPDEQG